VWNRARSTTVSGVNSVISTVRTLPGRIVDALSGAARWLYGVGSDIVHGLINGFLSALDWAIGIVKRAMDRIKKGAMDALNIGSPSKAFARDVGEPIPAGIIQGIRKGMPDLERLLQVRVGGLTGAAGAQVNVAAPNVAVGGPTVMVMLDGEEIGARVVTPQRVARVNAEGNRRRDFLNTGRAATA
jgi:phage-related protein